MWGREGKEEGPAQATRETFLLPHSPILSLPPFCPSIFSKAALTLTLPDPFPSPFYFILLLLPVFVRGKGKMEEWKEQHTHTNTHGPPRQNVTNERPQKPQTVTGKQQERTYFPFRPLVYLSIYFVFPSLPSLPAPFPFLCLIISYLILSLSVSSYSPFPPHFSYFGPIEKRERQRTKTVVLSLRSLCLSLFCGCYPVCGRGLGKLHHMGIIITLFFSFLEKLVCSFWWVSYSFVGW